MRRVQQIAAHVLAAVGVPPLAAVPTAAFCGTQKSDDDVVICCALRTPVGRARRGNLKDTPCEELLATLFRALLQRTGLNPAVIQDVQIGNASQPGAGAVTARVAQFLAGMPVEVPVVTINRQCSSGLQTVMNVAQSILTGIIDVGLAGGVESMSMFGMTEGLDFDKFSTEILDNELAGSCLLPMGLTSENVATKYGISREAQDRFAVESHKKALAAQRNGWFQDEIVPVKTKVKDAKGNFKEVVVRADEGPRAGTTYEGLSKLKTAFKYGGSTTAGNASQTSDGAALVLLARRSKAKELGLPVVARIRSFAVVGVDPALMGVGPAYAIPLALEKANLKVEDIDVFEVNEAFASQALMSIQQCKLPMEKVNPKGGAIALGHPLGCTGARQIATLLPELKRRGGKLGLTSMCVGTGMGAAAVFESEQ